MLGKYVHFQLQLLFRSIKSFLNIEGKFLLTTKLYFLVKLKKNLIANEQTNKKEKIYTRTTTQTRRLRK